MGLRVLRNQETIAERQLRAAFRRARNRRRVRVSPDIIRNTEELSAASPRSHRVWGNVLWSELKEELGPKESRPELFFVTLVDVACATLPYKRPDVSWMIDRYRSGLKGLNFIGVVEPALYTNIGPGTEFPYKRGLFWHIHAICWGDRDQVTARLAKLRSHRFFFKPIVPGGHGVHYDSVSPDQLAGKFAYMLKTPTKVYRIYPRGFLVPGGGEETKFRQRSTKDVRPGERLIYCHALHSLSLDRLTLAGGQGVEIRRRALRALGRR
jgi:hypothetical protein